MGRARRDIRLGVPHHIVHRGNHQSDLFICDDDRSLYLSLIHRFSRANGTAIAGFCLMRNHVHFIAVPASVKGLSRCFGGAHRKYSEYLNMRAGTHGTNWEGRFYSEPMSEEHALNALRYIERNPVHAGVVQAATDWPWSSAGTHCRVGRSWPLLNSDVRGRFADPVTWSGMLRTELDDPELLTIAWLHRAFAADVPLTASYQ